MKIRGRNISIVQIICLAAYYGFARYLPESHTYGQVGGGIRRFLCKRIFKYSGKCINVERMAWFASGVDIDAASSKLPDSWHFPSAGDVSSDWSVIVFGAPISPITVNGNNVANNAYAMVTVNLEAGNPYTSGTKSCYGLLLLRDGATIPSGYLSKVGSSSKYSDNPLTEEQFNDLVKMGSLFVSASGFYNKGGDKPGNTPWKEPANGHYWSTKQYNPYENYYYFGFNESGSVSATYHASNAGNYYKFVKLVKSIVD